MTDEPAEQVKEYKWEACDVYLYQSQFLLMVE